MIRRLATLFIFLVLFTAHVVGQQLSGVIRDGKTNEPIIGATVVLKGTAIGTTTDLDGKFELKTSLQPPFILLVSFVGFDQQEINVISLEKSIAVKLKPKELELKGVEVVGSRISEKQKEAALTVESMDIISIKECPQSSFYEALGTLKGVDLTSASLGFTIINTRGFNSTSPVRSLQVIDGVDNQAPGLNFSLGNFLGCSELDVLKVDLIAGASSAYYGPNAFNGVISMTTRSPFIKPGLEVSVKTGEQNLLETSVRWSQKFKNKNGKDKFAYKLNIFYMRANDWEADNHDATPQSKSPKENPGSYDAVNRYGDEYSTVNDASAIGVLRPGLGIWYRTGYWEKDIVDYNTRNLKLGTAFHYKVQDETELIAASNFGTGTTVYQGDNRYSLKDILFYQNRIEIRKADKFFFRVYATNEDAGKSYDAFYTALILQNNGKGDSKWAQDYSNYYNSHYTNHIRTFPGYPQPSQYPTYTDYVMAINPWLQRYYGDSLQLFHSISRDYADNHISATGQLGNFIPGTARFDSAVSKVTSLLYTEGGSRLFDRSALYHAQGEYKFTPKLMEVVVGGNFRLYKPDSHGTIFQDTGSATIENKEYGVYGGLEKKVLNEKLKLNLTGRFDKNENFHYLFSPAFSGVYSFTPKQIVRVSFSSAIRNPTLSDQYLFYNVGRAVLIGNIHGFDSLVTIPSFLSALNTQSKDSLSYFNVAPIQPEEVKTIEVGYRGTLFKNIYVDLVGYYSIYKNFIGYKIGADVTYDAAVSLFYLNQVYRVATNSVDKVTTTGASAGITWFFKKYYSLSGNYSYNKLDRGNSIDPLIPAYNTPRHKFNIGLTGRDIDTYIFQDVHIQNIGFAINYKWVDGFDYEGSPQFTGFVPSYSFLDIQFSYRNPVIHTTFKMGASNFLDNRKFTVYGGPVVGRLAYFAITVDLTK